MQLLENKLIKQVIYLSCTLLLCLAFNASGNLFADEHAPTIKAIEIEFIETHDKISEASVLGQLKVREGMLYDQHLVDQSIHSLYESGSYNFVEILKEPLNPEEVILYVRIAPSYRIQALNFEGNSYYKDSKLEDQITSKVNMPLDRAVLSEDVDALHRFYEKKGYSNATIDVDIHETKKSSKATVTFNINEGHKVKISKIKFIGNRRVKARELRSQMKTSKRSIFSFITGSGRFKEDEFDDDLGRLRTYYKDHGFLDVDIPQDKIVFRYLSPKKMAIEIYINEGKQYKIGSIAISDNTIYTSEELSKFLAVKSGDIAAPSEINKSGEAIRDFYGSYGYLDTFVYAERIPNVETGNIDLIFHVNESAKFYLESIEIEGNVKTKNRVILRELALEPGDIFDLVRMKRSKARLENTRFFDEVDVSPIPSKIPGRRNMRVSVTEARTANLSFGAGFSTLERWSIFTEFSQSNFDLLNYRNGFQGGGQKFRAKASLGTRFKEFVVGLEEPWLFERPLTLGAEVYHTQTNYVSSAYNEVRTGIEVYLSKYLFELFVGRLSYKLEQVDVRNVGSAASAQIKAEAGDKIVSKATFTLFRDTRNNIFMPTKGSRFGIINEVAGGYLGGQTDYYRIEGQAAIWIPTFKTAEQVLSFAGRTGTIVGFNNKSVPFFDRYFLGGPNTIRGFNYRGVGPKDSNGETLGGNTYGFFTTEYSVQLVHPIRVALFYDAGFVAANTGHWDVSSYNDSWGFGFRIPVMGAPVRLDFGFPLTSDEKNDHGRQFHFTFGTVF